MSEEERQNPMKDLSQEQIQHLNDHIEQFMQGLGKFAIRNDLGEQYDSVLMMAFQTIVQESVAEEEAVVAFAENFLEYCENLEENDMIQVQDSEEEMEKRFQEAKEEIKRREGRN